MVFDVWLKDTQQGRPEAAAEPPTLRRQRSFLAQNEFLPQIAA